MLLSKKAVNIKEYVAGEQLGNDYIKLNSNENPYPPSPKVLDALNSVQRLNFYPNPHAQELKEKFANIYGFDSNNIFIGNGSDEILALCFQTFFNPNAEPIIFPEITYSFYPVWADMYDIKYRTVPLEADFSLNIDKYFGLKNIQGFIIANPNAPTSLETSIENLEKIVCAYPDKVIIVDEAYVDFGTQSALDLVKRYDNVLVVRTFSKSWSLAGIRCGYAFGSSVLISGLEKIRDCFNSYSVDRMTQILALSAINDFPYMQKTVQKIKNTRDNLISSLTNNGYDVLKSSTNFLFMTHKNWSAVEVYKNLKNNKIIVRHFALPKIDNYLRVSIGTDEQMKLFFDTLIGAKNY